MAYHSDRAPDAAPFHAHLMAIQVYCNCGNPLFVPAELGGRKIKCQNCGDTLKVPKPDKVEPDPDEDEKIKQSGRYEVLGGDGKPRARTRDDAGGGGPVQLSCPACGAKVEPEEIACLQCGALLSGDASRGRGVLGVVPRPVLFLVVAVLGFGGVGLAIYKAWMASRPSSWTREGTAAMTAKDFALALESFEQALAYDPDYPDAIVGAAYCGVKLRRVNAIQRYAQRGVELCQDRKTRAVIRLGLADVHLSREKWRDAWNQANDAKHDDETIDGVGLIQGLASLELYEGAKGDEEAFKHFTEALAEGEQKDWRIYYHMARILHARKQHAEARPHAEKALELEPANARVWELAAALRDQGGDKAGARAATAKVVELEPENAPARARHSGYLLAMGDPESALREAQRAKELAPEASDAALALGRSLFALEKWTSAREELERAVKANAGWEAELLLGQTYYKLKDLRKGSEWTGRGLDKRKEDAALWQRAGAIALEAGDTDGAARVLAQAIKIDGKSYDARLGLARALAFGKDARKRNDRQIREVLEGAKELDASRTGAWVELAALHLELGRLVEALKAIDGGLVHAPSDKELLYMRGQAALMDKAWQPAIEAFEQVRRLDPAYRDLQTILDAQRDESPYAMKVWMGGDGLGVSGYFR